MNDKDYLTSIDDYLHLIERYEMRLEFDKGRICLHDGTLVILLGGIDGEEAEEAASTTAMVVIAQATEEEIKQLAAFVANLRKRS